MGAKIVKSNASSQDAPQRDGGAPFAARFELGGAVFNWGLFLCLSLLAVFLVYRTPRVITAGGLDPSWMYASEYAYLKGLTFGVDFAFTSGPLSFVYTGLFAEQTYPIFLVGLVFTAIVIILVLISSNYKLESGILFLFAVVLFAPIRPDAILYLIPFGVFLLIIVARVPRYYCCALITALPLLALAKFSAFILAAMLLAFADIVDLIRGRRWPLSFLVFLVASFGVYVASGQEASALGSYLINSGWVAYGYGKAMGNFMWSSRATAYVIVAVALGTSCSLIAYAAAPPAQRLRNLSLALGFCGLLFIVFKGSFVRAGHDLPSWSVMGIGCVLLASQLSYRWAWQYAGFGLALVAMLLSWPNSMRFPDDEFALSSARDKRLSDLQAQFSSVKSLLHPVEMWGSFARQRATTDAVLAAAAPKGLTGTVGAVPWDFAELIAAGYDFVPQPSLQQYSSYTPNLRQKDADHFASASRPQSLLFRLTSIDNRYPPQDFGRSLLKILQNYDLIDIQDTASMRQFILRSRSRSRPIETTPLPGLSGRLGAWFDVPPQNVGFIVASIHLHESFLGRLISLVYKQPHLLMEIRGANGNVRQYRYVPVLGEDGFALLPRGTLELEPQLFARLQSGPADQNPMVTAVRLIPEGLAEYAFSSVFEVNYRRVKIEGAPENSPNVSAGPMLRLMSASVEKTAALSWLPEGLLAHAPTRLVASFPSGRILSGDFGFIDGAWKTGHPKPIAFKISLQRPDGTESVSFARTLDPVLESADRGPQPFEVSLPQGDRCPENSCRLVFDTEPVAGNASWGWSYWGGFQIRDATAADR